MSDMTMRNSGSAKRHSTAGGARPEPGHGSPMAVSRRSLVLAFPCIFGNLAIGCREARAQIAETHPEAGAADETRSAAPDFPLAVKPGKRYLVDSAGKPFLVHGDTAWSLIAQLTREEVERYLEDRRARGFNTILVSLIENHYSANPPANAYGQRPFGEQQFGSFLPFGRAADYTTPNEAYFTHADWVLRRAAEKGLLVLLTPSYVGCCSDGWYDDMVANGPDQLRQYGEYLGQRYSTFKNILWVHAGDSNPPRKDLVRAIAEGIQKYNSTALHTAHGGQSAAIDYWYGEPWLQVNSVYTYGPVYSAALEQYTRSEGMPFFLIESAYENEHEATERRLRTQAYHAVLSGAAGQVFGNNPIWHFDSPNHWPAPVTWQEALGSRGAQSMSHLRALMVALRWWELQPDLNNTLLTDGVGSDSDRAVAASSSDRSFALVYLPSSRNITVNLGGLAGPRVTAHWYDPSAGRFSAVRGSPFPPSESRQVRPSPATNSSGFDDWVMILRSGA